MGEATSPRNPGHQLKLTFKKELLTLDEMVKRNLLPRVIQCDMGMLRNQHLDLSKPILAFSKRSVQKVSARSLLWDRDSRELKVTGSDLLIPEDYSGWFAIHGSQIGAGDLKSVTPYRTVTSLNKSKKSSFLIGGISPIPCFLVMNSQNSVQHIPHHVLPGDILRKASSHMFQGGSSALLDLNTYQEGQGGMLYCCETPEVEDKPQAFLMYHDEKDRSILINANQKGLFYVISQDGQDSTDETVTMQIKDIIKNHRLPLVVKLLHGLVPSVACGFTGTFLLTNVDKDDTVVASTLLKYHITSLEFPLDSDMLFQVAENTSELTSSEAWTNAVCHCQSRAPIYNKAIKVIADTDIHAGSDVQQNLSESNKREDLNPVPENSRPGTHPTEDVVQMRPASEASARRSRQSCVSDISKRVGVYALDFSINPRELSSRRNMRARDFQCGAFGQLQVDSGVFIPSSTTSGTSSSSDQNLSTTSSFEDQPSSAVACDGNNPASAPPVANDRPEFVNFRPKNTLSVTLTDNLIEETDSIISNGTSDISLVCVPGRPTDSNTNAANQDITVAGDTDQVVDREHDMVSYGFNVAINPENNVSSGGNSYNVLQEDPSFHVYNVFQHQDRFVSIGPGSYQVQQPDGAGVDPAVMPLYLFHGSLSSTDEYITPDPDTEDGYQYLDELNGGGYNGNNTSHSQDDPSGQSSNHGQEHSSQTPPQSDESSNTRNPSLPKRKPRPNDSNTSVFSPPWTFAFRDRVPPKSSGCYNKDLLIEELRKEISIDSAMELAFRGLTLAELTTLLYEDEIMDVHLTALLPKLGQLDLRKVALCLRSMRTKITLVTL